MILGRLAMDFACFSLIYGWPLSKSAKSLQKLSNTYFDEDGYLLKTQPEDYCLIV